jgi:O-glycosyl hydrolase
MGQPAARITVNAELKYQRWDGFGSSILSWQEPHPEVPLFKNLPRDVLEQAMQMAYRELGMTRARFFPRPFRYEHEWDLQKPGNWQSLLNLEAGDCDGYVATVLDLQRYGLREWYPCFQVDGRVPGGPPPWMRPGNGHRSLTPETYDTYIDLLMLLNRHWRDKFGVEPSQWSLCNEPTYAPNMPLQISLDGMLYLVKHLGRHMRAEGFGTQIVMPDDWTPQYCTVAYAEAVLADPEARGYVAAVGFHGYDGYEKPYLDWRVFDVQREWRRKLRDVCRYYNVPAWQTESTSIEPGIDPYDDGLFQANHIHDDMTCADAAAWDYMWGIYQSEWRTDFGWGPQSPVYIRFDDQDRPTDIFYTEIGHTIGHWSRAVQPGAVRVDALSDDPEVRVTAFTQAGQTTLVIINNRRETVNVEICLEGEPRPTEMSGFATVEGRVWQDLAPQGTKDGLLSQDLDARSITTLTFKPVTPIEVRSRPRPVAISADVNTPRQAMVGFGGTVFNWREEYWEAPRMARLPREVQDEAMRLAHDELGLSVGRTFPRVFPGDDGPVDFAHPSCDGITDSIRRSREYGLQTIFASALINTPQKTPVPQITKAWLEANGRTLRADHYQDYADHVVAFARHWRDDLGIELAGWGLDRAPSAPPTLPRALTPEGAVQLTKLVGQALENADLPTKVLVGSDAIPARGMAFVRAILGDEQARGYVLAAEFQGRDGYQSAYNDWRYMNGQRQVRAELASLCRAYDISLWQTESLTVRPATTSIGDAMFRANHIHDDLTYGEASVWLYRWLVWEGGWNEQVDYHGTTGLTYQNWGPGAPVLVYFDDQDRPNRVEIAKLGHTLAQWSRWVRPGARRVETRSSDDSVRVTAFAESDRLVYVVVNNHAEDVPGRITLHSQPTQIRCTRTSEHEDGVEIQPPNVDRDALELPIKAQSITTVVVTGQAR